MSKREELVEVVNGWIKDYYQHLKDGHPRGVHPLAKEHLIERVGKLLEEVKAAPVATITMKEPKAKVESGAILNEAPDAPSEAAPKAKSGRKRKAKIDG